MNLLKIVLRIWLSFERNINLIGLRYPNILNEVTVPPDAIALATRGANVTLASLVL